MGHMKNGKTENLTFQLNNGWGVAITTSSKQVNNQRAYKDIIVIVTQWQLNKQQHVYTYNVNKMCRNANKSILKVSELEWSL